MSLNEQPKFRSSLSSVILELAFVPGPGSVVPEFAGVLSATNEPNLVAILEDAFADAVSGGIGLGLRRLGWQYELWSGKNPTPLFNTLLANPHLTRRPNSPRCRRTSELAVLMVMRERLDLLDTFDPETMVTTLLRILWSKRQIPLVVAPCRRALRSFDEGPFREAVCRAAMNKPADYDGAAGGEARAAAVDTGYLPAESTLVPLFLVVTKQWDRFATVDQDGQGLLSYAAQARFCRARDNYELGDTVVERLAMLLDDSATPRDVRDIIKRVLVLMPSQREARRSRHRAEVGVGWSAEERRGPGGTGTAGTGGFSVHF